MKQITTLFIALILTCSLSAQQIQFQKTYGGAGTDYIWSVAHTSDGGYILAGETNSVGAGSHDAFLTKTDAFGTVQWTKTYGDTAYEVAYAVRQTSDGGFIVAGETESVGNGLGDIWIFKTNSTGTVTWQRTCGGSGGDGGNDIIQTLDGGYAVAGFQNNPSAGNDNACLLKLDGSGNIQWVHTYSVGTNDDYGYSVAQTTGGGYILAGESIDNVSTFVSNALIVRTDASGTLQSARTYGTTNDHWINSIIAQPSGNIVVAGVSSEVSTLNIWLAQLNPNGVPVWSNSYAGTGSNSDIGLSVAATPDGGFAICGKTNSFTVDDAAFLMKTDSTGAPEWSKTYGGNANDRADQVITVNGGYAIAATSLSFGNGLSGYFIKTDTNGVSGCNENIPSFLMTPETTPTSIVTVIDSSLTNVGVANNASLAQTLTETQLCLTVGENELASAEDLISVYPNPVAKELKIKNEKLKIEMVDIYNSFGEKIFGQQRKANNQEQIISIDVSGWTAGIYFVRIKTEDGFVIKKIVKQN